MMSPFFGKEQAGYFVILVVQIGSKKSIKENEKNGSTDTYNTLIITPIKTEAPKSYYYIFYQDIKFLLIYLENNKHFPTDSLMKIEKTPSYDRGTF